VYAVIKFGLHITGKFWPSERLTASHIALVTGINGKMSVEVTVR